MSRHTVVLTISLSVGFLDSLHDPSAYVAPHDIPDVAVPVYEHTLTAPPDSFRVPYVELQLSNGTKHSLRLRRIQVGNPGHHDPFGACVGSWFFIRKPGSGSRDTTSWRCVFPLANTHLPGAILNACRYERRLAEANAHRNTHFSVRHFRGKTSSEDSPCTSIWDINGGRSDDKTRWRSHLGMILRYTGRSSRKALTSSLMCGLAAGSYSQWRSTEAADVRCNINVDGSSPSLKRCIM